MTQRLIGPTGSPRRRWTFFVPLIAAFALGLMYIAGASAQLDRNLFELDRDATNDMSYPKIGVLNAPMSATAAATTPIQVCQDQSTLYNGAKILIDAERMTLASGANLSGGGCPTGFTFKRSYTATRAVDGTLSTPSPNGDHAKGENISRINTTTGNFAGDDWDDVFDLLGSPEDTSEKCTLLGAVECTFTQDGRSMSIFTQSKDYDEISDEGGATAHWQWRNQSVPDANELDDGFAIKYIDGNDDQQLYFGADRFATEGTKDAGFWFFHADVAALGTGETDSPFTGLHTAPDPGGDQFCNPASNGVGGPSASPICPDPDGNGPLVPSYDDNDKAGDILILTSFSGGGAIVTIRVFEWIGPAGSVAALYQRASGSDCSVVPANAPLCATVNNSTVETNWAYDSKEDLVNNEIPAGGLLEGGINLSDFNLEGCFSSFMAASRSSDTLTADSKDFILGSFEACGSTLTTTPADGSGTALTDSSDANDVSSLPDVKIGAGTTGVTVTDKASLNVTGITNWSGSVSFFLCGPLSYTPIAPATEPPLCTSGGVPAGTKSIDTDPNTAAEETATSDQLKLTSVGRYCWRGEFTSATPGVPNSTDATAGECFEVIPRTPSITTNATTAAEKGSAISDTASLTGTVNQAATNGGTTPGVAGSQYPSILAPATASNGAEANGSITFRAYKDSATCADAALDFTSGAFTVEGDSPPAYGPASYTPGTTGTYRWIASYTGDSPNTTSVSGACNDANETSVVVDARITIGADDTNEVGQPHTFTVDVEQDAGDGAGFVSAPTGHVDVTLSNSNGAAYDIDEDASTCDDAGDNLDTSGQCTITFTSPTAGKVTGNASVSVTVAGVAMTRDTDPATAGIGAGPGGSGPTVKTFVDANITIGADDVNEVGQPHTFTVTVKQNTGDGNGFVVAPTGDVNFTLTNANGAAYDVDEDASTCDDAGDNLDTSGQCTIVFSSPSAGTVTGNASVTLTVGGVTMTRDTSPATDDVGAGPGGSGPTVKRFVDAYITINPPEDTNIIGDDHTFTVAVFQDDGLAAAEGGDGVTGFGPAPAGTPVTVTLADDGTQATLTGSGDTCAAPGGLVAGECTVTFTSPTPGTVTGNASVTFTVAGQSLTRDTDPATGNVGAGPGGSGPAIKHFVAGSISWTKVDNAGNLQGGATFELCRTNDYDLDASDFGPLLDPAVCIDVVDDVGTDPYTGNDEDPDAGEFLVSDLPLGRYTVKETVAPPGYAPDPDTETVELTPGDTEGSVSEAFVNNRPIVKITGFGYTNEATGTPTGGIVSGIATFSVDLHNYGGAGATLSNSSLVANATGPAGGTLTCNGDGDPPALSKALTGTIAAGADLGPVTLVCTYTNMPDGKVIGATLNVNYTLNGLERAASGSPATVTFTVQSD